MSLQPGEPPAGAGTAAAADAARETDDPGGLQVDLQVSDAEDGTGNTDNTDDELVGEGLAPGVHEADKNAGPG